MRLLQYSPDGEVSLTDDLAVEDTLPPYAILSHTWGVDEEEVTFEDMASGIGKDKLGYKKIQFCAEQARQDGLRYFWIDTCCINKTNKAELSHAIKSMFRWYRNASRCYVFLSDVSAAKRKAGSEHSQFTWETAFRASRWFTRGWTLQELLAPKLVEFFSREHRRLGDKSSLQQHIYEITGIPQSALRGTPLSQFSVNERLSWIEHRQTKLAEDRVYCLAGIFSVNMSPFYGEGAGGAFKRLMNEIEKLGTCLKDLHLTDPHDDKKRIEETKGGLLKDSYRWVLDNASFQRWYSDPQSRLLWIKGDPGKGKTMLLCGIIDELQGSIAKTDLLSYFFCQASDARINSATAVLRGLLFLLVSQQPSLILHIRKRYDQAGKTMFEDANAWVALTEIFADVLRDPSLNTTYLIVDALDECITDLPKLLDFIVKQSRASLPIKWIVSSRNWQDIEEQLERAGHRVRLSLELNAESVSTAVSIFIEQKVSRLAQEKKYNEQTRCAVLKHLVSNANNTFLWVALVCQNLRATAKRNVLRKLSSFPPGLDSLYQRMLQQISTSDDAETCKHILASITLVYRPITLDELGTLVEQVQELANDPESIREIVGLCGSFLTLRDDTVYFVHQSAKDFLLTEAAKEVFPSGAEVVHHAIFTRSLKTMSGTLQRDIYGLKEIGYAIDDVKQPNPDPLTAMRYSCVYWIDHLCDWSKIPSASRAEDLQDGGAVHVFLRKKYLYWLEVLSLCKSIPQGVASMAKLQSLVQGRKEVNSFMELVYDAYRFIMSHKRALEYSPLQAYASVLLFSPVKSLVRNLFQHEEPGEIAVKPAMAERWSACLQTFEGHSGTVNSVAFSPDSTRLASASSDDTVKVWDASSGACLQTLQGHSSTVESVAFSPDSTRLASASSDYTVKVWDVSSRACLQTLKGHSSMVSSVTFSPDSTRLASASHDQTVKVWDASSGACLQTLKGHSKRVNSVAFSPDSTRLASASWDEMVKVWDLSNRACLQTLKGHTSVVDSVAFSPDSTRLASASWDKMVKVWDASSGACLQTLEGHRHWVSSVTFSPDSTRLASASWDKMVKVWDASSGACLQTLEGHIDQVRSVAFSPDSTRLVSASNDKTVKVWDASSGVCLQTHEGHGYSVSSVVFSPDSTWLASASSDDTVKVWDASSGACLHTLEGHSRAVTLVTFSPDSTRLASASYDKTVKVWDAGSGVCLRTLAGHRGRVSSIAFSPDSIWLASASNDTMVKVWNTSSGACLQTLEGHSSMVTSVIFSPDSTRLASASYDKMVKVWDASSGACLQTLKGHTNVVSSVAFSPDSTRLTSASNDKTVKMWDASSGACLQTLEVDKTLYQLSFDSTGSCLYTDIDSITITTSAISSTAHILKPMRLQLLDVGVSLDGMWLTYRGQNMLWIPSEYRAACLSVCGNMVGIGARSGRVWMCTIHLRHRSQCI